MLSDREAVGALTLTAEKKASKAEGRSNQET